MEDCHYSTLETAKEAAVELMHGWAERFEEDGYPPIPEEVVWRQDPKMPERIEPSNVPQYMGIGTAGYCFIEFIPVYDSVEERRWS
jgi:hypothetical protein